MKKDVFSILTTDTPYYIILDTNFLIDSLRHPQKFKPVIEELLNNYNVSFVTINEVQIEYYKGSNSQDDIKIKQDGIAPLNLEILPSSHDVVINALELAHVYMQNGKHVSITDYYLGATLMKYSKANTYLLSRDHSDFPSTIFNKEAFLVIELSREVQTYILYSFNEESYKKKAKQITK